MVEAWLGEGGSMGLERGERERERGENMGPIIPHQYLTTMSYLTTNLTILSR